MGFSDYIFMIVILWGAGYLLYRSIWKKKGHCQGCSDSGSCSSKSRH